MKKKIKVIKWIIGIIALSLILISIIEKSIQIFYLKTIGWDVVSFSTGYVFLAFIGSVAFVSLAFLERWIHKTSLKNPEQITVLVLGLSGLLYSGLILVLKLRSVLV